MAQGGIEMARCQTRVEGYNRVSALSSKLVSLPEIVLLSPFSELKLRGPRNAAAQLHLPTGAWKLLARQLALPLAQKNGARKRHFHRS